MRPSLRRFGFLVLLFVLALFLPCAAQASPTLVDVPCDMDSLYTAFEQAHDATTPTTLRLARACTYFFTYAFGGDHALPGVYGTVSILGQGATLMRAKNAPSFRFFWVAVSGNLSLIDLTLTQGQLGESGATEGGAIWNAGSLKLVRTTFRSNRSPNGGAIKNLGTLEVIDSYFDSNTADGQAGAISNHNSLTVVGSTFWNNRAISGGAIFLGELSGSTPTVHIANSTFAANRATFGGAILSYIPAYISYSTFANNYASKGGGALNSWGAGAHFYLSYNIFQNNPGGAIQLTGGGGGSSLEDICWPASYDSCNSISQGDPKLAPLSNNGGPTKTMMPQPGSAALNRGSVPCYRVDQTIDATKDQRGVPRPQYAKCDAGSVEVMPDYLVSGLSYRIQFDSWRGQLGSAYRRVSRKAAATAQLTFQGTTVGWQTLKGPNQGKASVKLDGVEKGPYDLYASTDQLKTFTYPNLANTQHTLLIAVLGTKNASAHDTNVVVDGFALSPGEYLDENSSRIRYDSWNGSPAGASQHLYRKSGVAGSEAMYSFTGINVTWRTVRGPNYGKAEVFIDGVSKGIQDLYAPTEQWVNKFYPLSRYGRHTIKIVPLHTKNASSTGYQVVEEGFSGEIK